MPIKKGNKKLFYFVKKNKMFFTKSWRISNEK